MKKERYNIRRRSQSLGNLTHYFSSSSDGSDESDLEELPQIISPKQLFRNPHRQQIRRSVITRNLNDFVSSTPLHSVRKTFNRTLTLSPIETENAEPTRHNSNSLELQHDKSKSKDLENKTKIAGKKKKSSNSKVIFPVENRDNVQNSALATILQSSDTFEKCKNDAECEKSLPLQSNNNASAKTNFRKTHSTHAQTSFPTPPSTVFKLHSRFTQTVADKETQIRNSLERYGTPGSNKSKRLHSKPAHPIADEVNDSGDDVTLTNQNSNPLKGFVDKTKKNLLHSIRRSPGMSPPHNTRSRSRNANLNVEDYIGDSGGNSEVSGNSAVSATPEEDQTDEDARKWLSPLLSHYMEETDSDMSRFSDNLNSSRGRKCVVVLEKLEDTFCGKLLSNQTHNQTKTTVSNNLNIQDNNLIASFNKSKHDRSTRKNKSNISQNIQDISRVNLGGGILENSQPPSSIFIQNEPNSSTRETELQVSYKSIFRNEQNDDNSAINNEHRKSVQHILDITNDIQSRLKHNTSKRKKTKRRGRESIDNIANHLLISKMVEEATQGDNNLCLEALNTSHSEKMPKINILDNHLLNSDACTSTTNEKKCIKRTNDPAPEIIVPDTHAASETQEDNNLCSEVLDTSHSVRRSKRNIPANHLPNSHASINKTNKKKRIKRTNNLPPKVIVTDIPEASETEEDNNLCLEVIDTSHSVTKPKRNIPANHLLNSHVSTNKTTEKKRIKRTNNPPPEVIVTDSLEVPENELRRSKRQRKPTQMIYNPAFLLTRKPHLLGISKESMIASYDMDMTSSCVSKYGFSIRKDSHSESKTSMKNTRDKRQQSRIERKVNNKKSSSKPKEKNEIITGSRKNRKNDTSKKTSKSNSEQYQENNLIQEIITKEINEDVITEEINEDVITEEINEDVITKEVNEDTETVPNIGYINNSLISEFGTDLVTNLERTPPRKAKIEDPSSSSILRDYFYFPQNNAVRRVAWCFTNPPLNAIDEAQRLRIAIGPKSSQAGFQSGLLEIGPGESKPKDMAVKFSLIFVVLEGTGLFQVHDSYRIVGQSAVLYVPLGAYYFIENKSETERLLLHYIQIKPHS